VFFAGVKLEVFGNIGSLLSELGDTEQICERSETGSDGSFVPHWTCLSLVTLTRRSFNDHAIKFQARRAIDCLSKFPIGDSREPTNGGDPDEKALDNARTIDKYFETASDFCVYGLSRAFNVRQEGRTEEQVKVVLARDHEADISNLERISPASNQMARIDELISYADYHIKTHLRQLSQYIPGVSFDELKHMDPAQFFDPLAIEGKLFTPQFIFLGQRLRLLCSLAPKLRDIVDGRGNGAYQNILESMKTLPPDTGLNPAKRPVTGQRHVMERQLWRLQDLCDGRGFGYSIERFFLALAQLLATAPLLDAHATAIYIRTFKAITSDWEQHKGSIGTQRVILNIVCDVASHSRGFFSDRKYPESILDELLKLLGDMIKGQSGSHINDAIEEINTIEWFRYNRFARKAIDVISRSRGAPAPSSPS